MKLTKKEIELIVPKKRWELKAPRLENYQISPILLKIIQDKYKK